MGGSQTLKIALPNLQKHGFQPLFHESDGGHTWINWRE
jgi:hypothetical protein